MDKLRSLRPSHGGNRAWASRLSGVPFHEILDFSASINPLGVSTAVLRRMEAEIQELSAYPDPDYGALRVCLADLHGVAADWVLPGNGAAELLTWAGRELSSLARVHVISPGFSDYQRALNAFSACQCRRVLTPFVSRNSLPVEGVEPEWIAGWHPIAKLNEVIAPVASDQDKLPRGLLLNNPHNPTGLVLTRESILSCLDHFEVVVVDEAFMDFVDPKHQQSLIDHVSQYPQLVVLRSLTKFYAMPGLRLGYAIAHPDRLRLWQRWRDPWPVNSLAVVAGMAAVQDHPYQQATRDWMRTVQPKLAAGLAQVAGLNPLASYVNFFLVRSQRSVTELQLRLLQHHQVLIRDCLSFPELGDSYFRVAVRTEAENQRLLDALNAELSA